MIENNIEIDNSFDFLSEIVAIQLGIEGYKIEARLNTLELYEEGGGYHWHQDTKKSKENFGSLFIHLPSYYEGGELFIKHETTTIKNIHNQQEGEDGFFYSAYYSDCFHKLETITKGNRIILFYDLILKDIYNIKEPNLSIINVNLEAKNKLKHFIQTIHVDTDHIVGDKPRFIFPLNYKYSDLNCSLKGEDRVKLSLLQNMKDENGNDLFFICLGSVERKRAYSSGYEALTRGNTGYFDPFRDKKDNFEITSLPHSLLKKPANFEIKLTFDEAMIISKNTKSSFDSFKANFALIWLTDHHFSIVSTWYDFTDDICELVKLNPVYGEKYLDDLITQGNYIETVKSTFLLQDKNLFLRAIACEPPEDTETFYNIISDSLEKEFVTWDEVIPQISRSMGKFDQNQAKFFSNIKDTSIKLNFFNEIKKSAKFESTGLHNWLDVHKEVSCSIDYLFENFNQKDRASNIKLFIYSLNHQLLQKALECGQYLCTIFASILISSSHFYDEIVSNFIKLNDDQCLRNLIAFLFSPGNKDSVWQSASHSVEHSCKLIPYIFDFLGQRPNLKIEQETLFFIFSIMIDCEEEKFFMIPNQFYILLFNRIEFERYNNSNFRKFINKIIKLGNESHHKSLAIKILRSNCNDILDVCKLTQSFSNILCDLYLSSTRDLLSKFVSMSGILIRYIDNNRLQNLLLFTCSKNIKTLMLIGITILDNGRANDCNLCSVLAEFLLKKTIYNKDKLHIFPYLLRIIRNDDIGAKFLHAIDTIIDNNADLLQKKFELVENLLFESDLHLESNIINYSSGFLFRIKSLISFEIDYYKTKKPGLSWIYPEHLLRKVQQHTLRHGIIEFLKQDIQDADFGKGTFTTAVQARNEATILSKSIPHIQAFSMGKLSSAYYSIRKNHLFPDPDKTNKKIEQLTTLVAIITSYEDELRKFGLPTISSRVPCADEPPMKQSKIN